MKVLMSALPSHGHVHPCLSIARELQAAGHEVRLATAPGLTAHVGAAGVTPLAMGFDIHLRVDGPLTPQAEERNWHLLKDSLGDWVDDLMGHARAWSPDVLLHDWSEDAGAVVSQRLGIPSAVLGLVVRPPMDYLTESRCWQGSDFPELDDPARAFGDVLLNLYPPSLAAPDVPRLAHEHYIRPPVDDGGTADAEPDWLAELGTTPSIYATMGTFYSRVPGVIEAIIEAAATVNAQVVVTLGRARAVEEFDPPPNVRVERYVPQSLLLSRCDAVICQGSYTAMMPALARGLPVGCIPVTWSPMGYGDAQVCERAGAGLTYPVRDRNAYGIAAFGPMDPRHIHDMMERLLADATLRAAARRIRDELEELPDLPYVVKLIESLREGPVEP